MVRDRVTRRGALAVGAGSIAGCQRDSTAMETASQTASATSTAATGPSRPADERAPSERATVAPEDGAAGINEALAENGIAYLEPGIYDCHESIAHDLPVQLVGAGQSTVLRSHVDEPLLSFEGGRAGYIGHFCIDGNRDGGGSGDAMFFGNHTGFITLSDLFISNCEGHAIHVAGGYNISFNQIRIGLDYHREIPKGIGGDGFHLRDTDMTHPSRIEFHGCYVYFAEGNGFTIDDSGNVGIVDCEANHCTYGVRLPSPWGVNVSQIDTEVCDVGIYIGKDHSDADGRPAATEIATNVGIFGGKNYDNETAIQIDTARSVTVFNYLNGYSTPVAIDCSDGTGPIENVRLMGNTWRGKELRLRGDVEEF